jgi:CheY-like chemotaxis protein
MAKVVLVIDDDLDVWSILSLRLNSFGYVMISAKTGSEGIEKARSLNPDLILLDFALPAENGLDILKKLKADESEAVRKIPVIMLTGYERHEHACLEAGADGYILKPFDLFQLKETLVKFLGTSSKP